MGSARSYPAIWLTPVLTDQFVADALRRYSAPSLLIGGTADPMWSTPAASPADQEVPELDRVDHSVHRAGDWQASLAALRQALTAIETFAEVQPELN